MLESSAHTRSLPLTPADWLRAADANRRIGHHIEVHDEIGSTNDRARDALVESGGVGRAVVADVQTAGRGRQGRPWLSPPGVNLLVSVAIRPRVDATSAWQLGFAVALAARWAARSYADLWVKWPNDLYTAEGLKVGGILVETAMERERLAHAVVGLGVNVNWRRDVMPAEVAATATSLADVWGADIDRVELLSAYLAALDREVAALEAGISPIPAVRERSWLDGRRVRVTLPEGDVEGDVTGIGDDGALLVRTTRGLETIVFGDAVHVESRVEVAA